MIDVETLLHCTLYIVAIITLGIISYLAITLIQLVKQIKEISRRVETLTDIQGWLGFFRNIPFFKKKRAK